MKFSISLKGKFRICKTSGIYQIRNSVNSKVYVGYAPDLYFRINVCQNKLKRNTHTNLELQKIYNENPDAEFCFEVLCNDREEKLKERKKEFLNLIPYEDRLNVDRKTSPIYLNALAKGRETQNG